MTTHARDVAERQAKIEAQQAKAAEKHWDILGRPLTHAIRYTLNVHLERDLAWVESCRDSDGEELLTELRARYDEMKPGDWRSVREGKTHVWRVLVDWMQRSNRPPARNLSGSRLSEPQARAYMAGFCRE